ncbi:MAG: asparagine synthase (glutamine-hydrolyzing) [Spirochaetales bacterium]|nr:asparagine synthase (glutamine-hydrolyzing) [Spirochaetales bacterium]
MCGITGVLALAPQALASERFKPMVDIMAHRGPDDAGYLVWQSGRLHKRSISYGQDFTDGNFHHISPLLPVIDSVSGQELIRDEKWDLFLGHRRLSIIDLSARGHQPMCDRSRQLWLVYNGELYNFRELRQELKNLGYDFTSRSDTEVIIHAYREWGVSCIERFNGMFAFALYDNNKKALWLARDRYGIKPLYYTQTAEGEFVFGSEIKSILQYLPAPPQVDLAALNEYFSFQNTFSYRTLFEGIRLLEPGHFMEIDLSTRKIKNTQYWDFNFHEELKTTQKEQEETLYNLLVESIRRQCVSDVPIGSYLSGGMDSGSVTAVTASVFGRIATFTMGFDLSEAAEHEQSFDERELAEHMANLFQTEHYECVLHSGDMEAVMEKLIWHLEDIRVGQCYPNYYISRLASKFVKVVMCGTGGDELFGGYPWRYAAAIGDSVESYTDNYYRYWKRLVPNKEKPSFYNEKIIEQLKNMNIEGAVPFKDHTITVFRNVFPKEINCARHEDQINNSLYFECKTFLHGLLVVEDKLSMAHSLETRVPLLDNELVDFAVRVPVSYKLKNIDNLKSFDENIPRKKDLYYEETNVGKNILRKSMERIVPEHITRAKKQGFSAPDESWFRGRSEKYIREMFSDPKAKIYDYLNFDYINKSIDLHCKEKKNKRLLLWSLLSFEWWLRTFATN